MNENLFSVTKISSQDICYVSSIEEEIDPDLYEENWFIKIDVQGSELNVLKSISQAQYKKIKWIYIEVTDYLLYKNQASRNELKNYLELLGFELTETFNQHFLDGKLLYADLLFTK